MRPRTLIVLGLALTLVTAGCLDTLSPSSDDGDGNDTVEPTGRDDGPSDENSSSSDEGANESEGESNRSNRSNETSDGRSDGGSSDDARSYPPWPEPSQASVRPGVQIRSSSGQCTSNFLFRTPSNSTLMLGVAAHCVSENPRAGDGCDPATEPFEPGTEVRIDGASNRGVLVYSSWFTMQATEESDSDACRLNDFALIAIDQADRTSVHPALMHYGGPTALAGADSLSPGDKVLWYGNSGTRAGIDELQRNEGYVVREDGSRGFVMYSATPGVPGDSGSAVIAEDGAAAGILSTVRIAPESGSNGVALLEPALAYANQNGIQVELVTWELFEDGQLP